MSNWNYRKRSKTKPCVSFDYHLSEICKKADRKLYALGRVTPYMNLIKRKILMNVFFNSQFSYCPLIWMCHSSIQNRNTHILAT